MDDKNHFELSFQAKLVPCPFPPSIQIEFPTWILLLKSFWLKNRNEKQEQQKRNEELRLSPTWFCLFSVRVVCQTHTAANEANLYAHKDKRARDHLVLARKDTENQKKTTKQKISARPSSFTVIFHFSFCFVLPLRITLHTGSARNFFFSVSFLFVRNSCHLLFRRNFNFFYFFLNILFEFVDEEEVEEDLSDRSSGWVKGLRCGAHSRGSLNGSFRVNF